MTTITSSATGNWNAGTTWTGGVPPATGDVAQIQAAHTVTVNVVSQCLRTELSGGIVYNADFTFDDAPGAGLIIESTGSEAVSSNGTGASPRTLKSASVSPSYPWAIHQYSMSAFDSRALVFDYILLQGNTWTLGYGPQGGGSWVGIVFNDRTSSTSSWINTIPPLGRVPNLIEHPIDGRMIGSRVYQRGNHAGAVTLTGWMYWSTFDYTTVKVLQESGQRMALYTERVHLPKVRFDSAPKFDPKPGLPYVPFSITLIEDQ